MIGTILLAAVINLSSANPRYFETADGKPWIPVGCNICFDRLQHRRSIVVRVPADAVEGVVRPH